MRTVVFVLLGLSFCTVSAAADTDDVMPETLPPDARRTGMDFSPFPQPDAGYVTDVPGVLTEEEEQQMERWLWQVEKQTGVEMLVVIITSIKSYPDTPYQNFELFASGMFDKYEVGNSPQDDGLLLLVSLDDRKALVAVGDHYGYREAVRAERIVDNTIVPGFQTGEPAVGIVDGVKAVMLEFTGVRVGTNWLRIGLYVGIPALLLTSYSLFTNGKRGWGWVCAGLLLILVLLVVKIFWSVLRYLPVSTGKPAYAGGFSGGGGAVGGW